jgi:hypothetical protein
MQLDSNLIEAEVEKVIWSISKFKLIKPRIKIKPVNLNGVTINYTSGLVTLKDLNVNSISTPDNLMRISIESERGIITSSRDTIITIDEADPTSITTDLSEV